jgi:hypothetical protein
MLKKLVFWDGGEIQSSHEGKGVLFTNYERDSVLDKDNFLRSL